MSEEERAQFSRSAVPTETVEDYVDRLLKADALVLVLSGIWNYGFPGGS